MTKQEIFDKVATHLLKQGRKSMDATEYCLYRGPDGLKCAVGCLIPDRLYRKDMEGMLATTVVEQYPKVGGLLGKHANLIRDLQYVHDKHDPEYWPDRLAGVAAEYLLSTEVLG